jgi:hypothetical protein
VFHGVREFNLKEGPFLNNLAMNMRKYFPDIGDEVLGICVGGPDYKQKKVMPAGTAGRAGLSDGA